MAANKYIDICSDGTGNTAIKDRGTNVFKIFEAVDIYGHWTDPGLSPQVAIYDDGVGTQGFKPLMLLGGAFGWGLSRNIRQLYTELVRVYEPGDNIYLFGFSRGAFTVRSLAGFIGICGIIDRAKPGSEDLPTRVNEAYGTYRATYRDGGGKAKGVWEEAESFRLRHAVVHGEHAPEGRVRIRFIGVWDTVDAVGLPFDELSGVLNRLFRFKFPDHVLGDHVQRACHALSIDDERRTFHPLMWDETAEKTEEGTEGRIEQLWFPGVHSNVGGGYPKQGMSLVSLYWMMNKAKDAGLRFVESDWQLFLDHQNPFDKLYDSRAGLGVYYRYLPRDIEAICRTHGVSPKIHFSAVERVVQGSGGYAPGNIPTGCRIVATDAGATDLASIGREITTALQGRRSLLESVRPWVWILHYSHLVFLAASLAAVALVLWDSYRQWGGEGISFSFGGMLKLAACLIRNPKLYGLLLLICAVFYLIGWLAKIRMGRVFAGFWRTLHDRLRDTLYPGRTGAAPPPPP